MKLVYSDPNAHGMRATEQYWLPNIPELDTDLNTYFTDEEFEELLESKPLEGKKEISLAIATAVFNKFYAVYPGLGFRGVVEKAGYTIKVSPEEYRITAIAS